MSLFSKKDIPPRFIRIPLSDTIALKVFERRYRSDELDLKYEFKNKLSEIITDIYKELPNKKKPEHSKFYEFYCSSGVSHTDTGKPIPGITAVRKRWKRTKRTEELGLVNKWIYDFNIQGVWDAEGPRLEIIIINGGPKWSVNLNNGIEPEWNPPPFILEILEAFPAKLEAYFTTLGDLNVATRMSLENPDNVRAYLTTTDKILPGVRKRLPEVLEDEILSMVPKQHTIPPNLASAFSPIVKTPRKKRRNTRRNTRRR
jgi:hypothetical protein